MIKKRKERIDRIRHITNVFIRHGFGYVFSNTPLSRFKKFDENDEKNRGKRLKNALEELGTTFIKMGQLLANRPDLVPDDIVYELKKLQEDVKPFSFDEVKRILIDEGIYEKFEYIDPKPVATASVGQVHAGYIKGKKVAIKVRRPNIDTEVKTDIEILKKISNILDRYSPVKFIISFTEIVNEISDALLKEIDFSHELNNIKRIKKILKQNEILVPNVLEELSSDKVLVTDFIEAKTLNSIEDNALEYEKKDSIAKKLVKTYLSQIFEIGVFHADPHPGNILITNNGEIAFVDFGMIGFLSNHDKENLSKILLGIMLNDKKSVIRAFKNLRIIDKDTDFDMFYSDLENIVNGYINRSITSIKVTEIFNDVFKLTYKFKMKIPEHFVLLGRTLSLLENDIAILKVELNILEELKPYASKMLIKNRIDMIKPNNLLNTLFSYANLIDLLPDKTESILEKLDSDDVTLNLKFRDLEKILNRIERLSNKFSLSVIFLSVSIIIAGMTIGGLLSPALYKSIISTWYLWALRLGILILIVLIIVMIFMIIKKER